MSVQAIDHSVRFSSRAELPTVGTTAVRSPFGSIWNRTRQDDYFSPSSLRAQVHDFIDGDQAVLSYNLAPAKSDGIKATLDNRAILLSKQNAGDADAIRLQVVDYRPLNQGQILQQVVQMKNEAEYFGLEPRRIAYNQDKRVLLTDEQMAEQKVVRADHPLFGPMSEKLKDFTDNRPNLNKMVSVADDGTVTLFNRWAFNLARIWKNEDGERFQVMDVMRMPNGMLAQVNRQVENTEFKLDSPSVQKEIHQGLLRSLEAAEQRGFVQQGFEAHGEKRAAKESAEVPANPFRLEPSNLAADVERATRSAGKANPFAVLTSPVAAEAS